jgi:hypothetical protein
MSSFRSRGWSFMVSCLLLAGCGSGNSDDAPSTPATAAVQDAGRLDPRPRQAPTGNTSRDFMLLIDGVAASGISFVQVGQAVTVVPMGQDATSSTVHWGHGGAPTVVPQGWRESAPDALTHIYASAGAFRIRYVTTLPNAGSDERSVMVFVSSAQMPWPAVTPLDPVIDPTTGDAVPSTRARALPVLNIQTQAGAPIVSKEDYVPGQYTLTDERGTSTLHSGALEVRLRGNFTATLEKKPYRLRLGAAAGLLQMPGSRHWVLLANHVDKTMLRTDTAFELSRRLGFEYTVRSEFVHVTLNGSYEGVYQLAEQIRIDPNRVNMTPIRQADTMEPALTGGYLLEVDARAGESFCFPSKRTRMIFCMKDPDTLPEPAWTPQRTYIQDYVDRTEDAIFGESFTDPVTGYASLLDVASTIDYFIAQELLRNRDGNLRLSTFLVKKRGGKLGFGPLWDFDLSLGASLGSEDPEGWFIRTAPWFTRLFEDPVFRERVKVRWNELVAAGKIDSLVGYVDRRGAEMDVAQAYNFARWDILDKIIYQNATLPGTYRGEVADMRRFLARRIAWMGAELNRAADAPPPPHRTGSTSRDFSLLSAGRVLSPPLDVSTGQEVVLQPVTEDALVSVVHWGDGVDSIVPTGWRVGMPPSALSHSYATPGTYTIEYATLTDGRWLGRTVSITVTQRPRVVDPVADYTTGSTARDFSLRVDGRALSPPFALTTNETVVVRPATQDASVSVAHWGDGSYSVVPQGWRASTPANMLSHTYAQPGNYVIEHAILLDGQWTSRMVSVTVTAAPPGPPPPPPPPIPATTGDSSRDFSLRLDDGSVMLWPFTLRAGQTVVVRPATEDASVSVAHWGDSTYTVLSRGWRSSLAPDAMSHAFDAPGSYRIEYATQIDGEWLSRMLTVNVVSAPEDGTAVASTTGMSKTQGVQPAVVAR